MASTIFYSWQSDLPNNVNRGFIEDSLEKAIKQINEEFAIDPSPRQPDLEVDRDTRGVSGSPPIVDTIFGKISAAIAFVADMTFVGKTKKRRLLPNPNVSIEYGWALSKLGYQKIIAVMNTAYGEPSWDSLPFNMRHLRWPIRYHVPEGAGPDERRRAKEQLIESLHKELDRVIKAEPSTVVGDTQNCAAALEGWHRQSHERYMDLYVNHPVKQWSVPRNVNHFQMSYLVCPPSNVPVDHDVLVKAIARGEQRAEERIRSGWGPFFALRRDNFQPYVQPDLVNGEDREVIESNLLNVDRVGFPDFWRFSNNGYATIVRPYREDEQVIDRRSPPLQPGTWLSPRLLVQQLIGLVAHAEAMLDVFSEAGSVEFRCSWYGLTDRKIEDFDLGLYWGRHVCKAATRTSSTKTIRTSISKDWPSVVKALANPVLILFDGMQINDEFVIEVMNHYSRR